MRVAEQAGLLIDPMRLLAARRWGCELSHSDSKPCRQKKHLPQAIVNGTTTRSPFLRVSTSGPTSTHFAHEFMAEDVALLHGGNAAIVRCRSEPQMAVRVTLTSASWWFRSLGSGTDSTRTSCLPYQQTAFMRTPPDWTSSRLPMGCRPGHRWRGTMPPTLPALRGRAPDVCGRGRWAGLP